MDGRLPDLAKPTLGAGADRAAGEDAGWTAGLATAPSRRPSPTDPSGTSPDVPGPVSGCPSGGSGFDTNVTGVALDRRTRLQWQRLDPPKPQGWCAIQP